MYKLLLFFIYMTVISFIAGFSIYWWKVDKIKSITSAIVIITLYIAGWYFEYKLVIDEVDSLLLLIAWNLFCLLGGYKVRTLKNEKLPIKRRRR